MANFNVNQVRQLYVAKTAPQLVTPATVQSLLTTPGDFGYGYDKEGNLFFASCGANGELVRSDLIDAKSIKHVTYLTKTKDVYALKKATVAMLSTTNSGNPVAGQDYTIVVKFNGLHGFGPEYTYVKIGSHKAVTGETAAQLLGHLAVSLFLNMSADDQKLANVYCGSTLLTKANVAAHVAGTTPITGASVVIEEVEQPWVRGTKAAIVIPFDVTAKYINDANGNTLPWATVTPGASSTTIKNSKKIADLEYFCMGERGDWYRNVGWPNVIQTKYLVPADSTDAAGYNVLTIHYKYIGGGDEAASRLSVKDIQIVSTTDLSAVASAVAELAAVMGNPPEVVSDSSSSGTTEG